MSRTVASKTRPVHRIAAVTSPICVALGAGVFAAVADWVVLPLHRAGRMGAIGAWVGGVSRLLELPGFYVARALDLRPHHHATLAGWVCMAGASAIVHAILAVLVRGMWRGWGRSTRRETLDSRASSAARAQREEGSTLGDGAAHAVLLPARTMSRRRLLTGSGRAALVAAAGVGGYAFAVEPHRIEFSRRLFPMKDLPRSLSGLTVVQVTDIHHGPWTSIGAVRALVQRINAIEPDLIALTGDYVHQSADYIAPVIAELAKLRARVGVVATLGNHDWWEDGWQTLRRLREHDIPIVDNGRLFITPSRQLVSRAPEGLCIAGVGDLWEGTPDYHAALDGVAPWMPRLLLSHNPDVAEERAFVDSGHRVDLMLSGHTHGGQIYIPGVGTPMLPSRYGQKYASGLVQGPTCPVYVCRGVGTTIMPLRLGVRPEVAVIHLATA